MKLDRRDNLNLLAVARNQKITGWMNSVILVWVTLFVLIIAFVCLMGFHSQANHGNYPSILHGFGPFADAALDATPFDFHNETATDLHWASAQSYPAENCHRFEFELPGTTWIWQLNHALSQLNVVAQPADAISTDSCSKDLSWRLGLPALQASLITTHVRLQI